MIPRLTARGFLILASAALVLLVGALHGAPPLVGLGGVVLAALSSAYLVFYPTAVLLRRKKIELSWWVPPGDQPGGALAADRPFQLHIAFRNHGARTLRVLHTRVLASSSLDVDHDVPATVAPGKQVEVVTTIKPRAAGYQVLHGAALTLGDVLGLFDVEAYFPNPVAVKVFPRQVPADSRPVRPAAGALHEQVGLHHVRRRGLAGELREIREHAHGDAFKFIAWKATARRQQLMVRELDSEIVVTHQLLLDLAGSMRTGPTGHGKLDHAIEIAAALARTALDAGDRVGLLTFDTRVYSELRPGAGHQHYLKLVDRLIESHNVVDEDLTDLTDGELVATVASYLAHQEAVDVRLRQTPALDDPLWQRIHAGPGGQLFDLRTMDGIVSQLLRAMGQRGHHKALAPAWWWSRVQVRPDAEPLMARLRLFCRLRGIALPYRLEVDPRRRASGMADALQRACSQGRPDSVLLLSDLQGLAEAPEAVLRALSHVRRPGQSFVAIAPHGPGFRAPAEGDVALALAGFLGERERDLLDRARRLLLNHGVGVVEVTGDDSPAAVLQKLRRPRQRHRRVA
jgi:uncharacterized protein (DUF58 family)